MSSRELSGFRRGPWFYKESHARRILAEHAREKCVVAARMPKVMTPKLWSAPIEPLETSGP
jgi:hypothetical protein